LISANAYFTNLNGQSNKIRLLYDQVLSSSGPLTNHFTIRVSNSSILSASAVTVDGSTVEITTSGYFNYADVVGINYRAPTANSTLANRAIQDINGLDASSTLTDGNFFNNSYYQGFAAVSRLIDTSPPSVSVSSGQIIGVNSAGLVASTELGRIYLVPSEISIQSLADINSLLTTQVAFVDVLATSVTSLVSVAHLTAGTYAVYAIDWAGRVSARALNTIRVDHTSPSAIDLDVNTLSVDSSQFYYINLANIATGVNLFPNVKTPAYTDTDIFKIVIKFGGDAYSPFEDGILLQSGSPLSLNTNRTGTIILGGVSGVKYDLQALDRTLSLQLSNNANFTPAQVKTVLGAIAYKPINSNAYPGERQFTLNLVDLAGNVSSSATVTVQVDNKAPEALNMSVIDTGSSGTDHITNHPTIAFDSLPVNTLVKYQVDGGVWNNLAANASTLQLLAGAHNYQVKAVDLAGNESSSKFLHYQLDTVSPTVQVTLSKETLATPYEELVYTLKFTEPVVGLSSADINVINATVVSPLRLVDDRTNTYSFSVRPAGLVAGNIDVNILNSSYFDVAGNANEAVAVSVPYQPPTLSNLDAILTSDPTESANVNQRTLNANEVSLSQGFVQLRSIANSTAEVWINSERGQIKKSYIFASAGVQGVALSLSEVAVLGDGLWQINVSIKQVGNNTPILLKSLLPIWVDTTAPLVADLSMQTGIQDRVTVVASISQALSGYPIFAQLSSGPDLDIQKIFLTVSVSPDDVHDKFTLGGQDLALGQSQSIGNLQVGQTNLHVKI
ncbi:MAG: Ig-like domain-containing protein, partial [Gammaproteobacteria bacterium]|nr:Ig-like domain-containing protein [Gammaproteobacteria bacterium]